MSERYFELFGGPRLLGGYEEVRLTPYQEFLLMIVAGHGARGLSRTKASWLLWEEDDSPRTRHRLRQLLHGLRRRIGIEVMDGSGPDVLALDPSRLPTDLDRLGQLLRRRECHEAARLCARGLGSGIAEPPTRAFTDWLETKAAGVSRQVRVAASKAWDETRPQGEWPAARDAAEALHLLDPDDENALQCVLEARAMTGSLQAALAAFADFRDRVQGQGGVSVRTREIVERIRKLGSRGRGGAGDPTRPTPFVGRRQILEQIRQRLNRVLGGDMEFLLLAGEAGIGKSRILQEAAKEGSLMGLTCLHAQGNEVERHIPLNALMDALHAVDVVRHVQGLAQPWRTLVGAFLPPDANIERLPEIPFIQEDKLNRRLLDAFRILMDSVVDEGPTLLCIDDLQWIDNTTLAFLQFILRRWNDRPFGIVGTVRASPQDGQRAASQYLGELLALTSCRLSVGDLSEDEAKELVRQSAGRELSEDAVAGLLQLGGRNPFFLVELTSDLMAGRLRLPDEEAEAVAVPVSLQSLFENRIEAVSDTARDVSEMLAVHGRPLRLSALAGLVNHTLEECAAAVDELMARRLASVEQGSVWVAHELFRSALYRLISPARLGLRHLRLARYLEEHADPKPHGELAIHYARAGEAEAAVKHGRIAADEAVENGAIPEATHFLRIVVDNEHREAPRAEATGDLARLLHVNRDMAKAAPLLDLASTRLRRVGKARRALRMDIRRVESLVEVAETPISEAVADLTHIRKEAEAEGDWTAVAMALDTEMHLLHQVGDLEGIQAVFEGLKACAEREDPEAACIAYASLALNILFGDPDVALSSARKAVEIAEAEGLTEHLLMARTRLMVVLIFRGRLNLPAERKLTHMTRKLAAKAGNWGLRLMLEANVGAFLTDIGEFSEADRVFRDIARPFQSVDARIPAFNFLVNWGHLAMLQYEFSLAMERFRLAEELVSPLVPRYMIDLLNAQIGLCAFRHGDLRLARERAELLRSPSLKPHFDPTPIYALQAAMALRARSPEPIITQMAEAADALKPRLILPWIKMEVLLAETTVRAKLPPDSRLLEALDAAQALRLSGPASQLERLQESLRS